MKDKPISDNLNPFPFDKFDNCTYTSTYLTNEGKQIRISITALFELMDSIPKPLQIFTMPIQLKEAPIIPDNTIFISSDIAKLLEDALK